MEAEIGNFLTIAEQANTIPVHKIIQYQGIFSILIFQCCICIVLRCIASASAITSASVEFALC